MGRLHGDLEMAIKDIGVNLNQKFKKCHPILLIMDKIWDAKLKSPLCLSAHLLNPFFYYQHREDNENDGAFLDAFTKCLHKMYGSGHDIQVKISA